MVENITLWPDYLHLHPDSDISTVGPSESGLTSVDLCFPFSEIDSNRSCLIKL